MLYVVLFPQNGDRVVTIDVVTSLSPYAYESNRIGAAREKSETLRAAQLEGVSFW